MANSGPAEATGAGGLGNNDAANQLVRLALRSNLIPSAAQSFPSLAENEGIDPSAVNENNMAAQRTNTQSFLATLNQTLHMMTLVSTASSDSETDFIDPEHVDQEVDENEDDECCYSEEFFDGATIPGGIGGGGRAGNNKAKSGGTNQVATNNANTATGGVRGWNDDFVLKRHFSALIPAFDPRPGRTNVPQTQDLEVPMEGSSVDTAGKCGSLPPMDPAGTGLVEPPRLILRVRGPNLANVADIELTLADERRTIFSYIQTIVQECRLGTKADKARRIWEPTYAVIYQDANSTSQIELNASMVNSTSIPGLSLGGRGVMPDYLTSTGADNSTAASAPTSQPGGQEGGSSDPGAASAEAGGGECSVVQLLQLLSLLKEMASSPAGGAHLATAASIVTDGEAVGSNPTTGDKNDVKLAAGSTGTSVSMRDRQLMDSSSAVLPPLLGALGGAKTPSQDNQGGDLAKAGGLKPLEDLSDEAFLSDKITQKLLQQLQDPLVVSASALPEWMDYFMTHYPILFSFATRVLYLQATAFGTSRAIIWLQTQREKAQESLRSAASSTRREDAGSHSHEYRIGRIMHERVKVRRAKDLLHQGITVMRFHAERKSILEIEFVDEEGTGLGPSLEFYALMAAELQRKPLAIWLCDDIKSSMNTARSVSVSSGDTLAADPVTSDPKNSSSIPPAAVSGSDIDLPDVMTPSIDPDPVNRSRSRIDSGATDGKDEKKAAAATGTRKVDDSDLAGAEFIHPPAGLFPAPLPQDSPACDRAVWYFHSLGILLAKVIQDSRLIDLPLATAFLKLLAYGRTAAECPVLATAGSGAHPGTRNREDDVSGASTTSRMNSDDPEKETDSGSPTDEIDQPESSTVVPEREQPQQARESAQSWVMSTSMFDSMNNTTTQDPSQSLATGVPSSSCWFEGVFTWEDFTDLYPIRAEFLGHLRLYADRLTAILTDPGLSGSEKHARLRREKLTLAGGVECDLEDLGLTFHVNPSSSVYGFTGVDLIPDGDHVDVKPENLGQYISLCWQFYMHVGIRRQLDAFRAGFCRVFPMEKLRAFNPDEIRSLLCGNQYPAWTREDVVNFTEPKLGYDRTSPAFLRFADVMAGMDGPERKAFLQFTTGCSCLPPGGLAKLHPRLTIVRKVDGGYPSVNTCVHYLKLPEYPTVEMMRERLVAATREKGFHLN